MDISVVGLGKLGAPLCAVLASKGHRVIGVDVAAAPVHAINTGLAPVSEPHLAALIAAHRTNLSATTDLTEAVRNTSITMVIVPTPSTPDGAFDHSAVVAAVTAIGHALADTQRYHLVVVTSTVMPGAMEGTIRPALENTGRRLGDTLGLCYNPEFIALGDVINGILRPDVVLIGESDPQAGNLLEQMYATVCENAPALHRMNFVNAELTKLAINTFVTTKISYANMLSDICDRLPGADCQTVTAAVGADSRIGSRYLQGATGYGGPCFPRDNIALAALAREVGTRPLLPEATDAVNRAQVDRLLDIVGRRVRPEDTIGVLGLSYKPDTAVIEESQGLLLTERLVAMGRRLVVYDPEAMPLARTRLGDAVAFAASAEGCIAAAQLLVVMTPWAEFRTLPPVAFRSTPRRTVIDAWRVLPSTVADVADLLYLGHGATSSHG